MQLLAYILMYPILWFISILPFRILYIFSDFVCFWVYNVFGYRKKTVRKNIALTLPHLTAKERLDIERKFYTHMCDMFLEMIKTMSISEEEINRRFVITNIELIKEYENKGKSVILMCAHYASWEWLINIAKKINFSSIGIYKKINNKYFDKLIRKIRSRLSRIGRNQKNRRIDGIQRSTWHQSVLRLCKRPVATVNESKVLGRFYGLRSAGLYRCRNAC